MKTFLRSFLLFALLFAFSAICFGQSGAPAAPLPLTNGLAGFLDKLSGYLSNTTVLVVAGFLYEFICRFVPTTKAAGLVHTLAAFARLVANGLTMLAEFTDKVIPFQNLSPQLVADAPTEPPKPAA